MKTIKEHDIHSNVKNVISRRTLNYTDIVGNSNKFYNLEIQEHDNKLFYIFTSYGRNGGAGVNEYRECSSQAEAEKEAEKIIKSKNKKGYVEVLLKKSNIGSSLGKNIELVDEKVSVDELKKAGVKIKEKSGASKLSVEIQDLVKNLFNITGNFVSANLDTKKCSLGDLSTAQIMKGRNILDEARKVIHASNDINELNKLTSLFYSNIPFNFGYRKIDADSIRLNTDQRIDAAFDTLDIFSGAKDVEDILEDDNQLDNQYKTMNTEFEWVDPSSPTFKWMDKMLHDTRASNHHFLGKLKLHKVYKMARNGEDKIFLSAAERIAKECGKFNPSRTYDKLVRERPDLNKDEIALYNKANICPTWHGTRRANVIGISTKGFLIRPSGVPHAGSAYGDGIYLATNSTKSINYCDVAGSYWAGGGNNTKAYMFLVDGIFGNYKYATGSHFYTEQNIAPAHSVFAEAGKGGVYNDEIMLYNTKQHKIRYLVEFETMVR